ncbi:MAG TPA: glutathione S-transferase family protein [Rhizomicrobium sp.]|nr:glutathione S-transferase family protein [Rhizomicrobium sp.]
MSQITFHSMADSAYLWTAMHVADEKGVAYEFRALEYRSPEHFALHPFGKMPVMQHGDFFLYETAAIAHYIDRAFEGPPLQPAGAREQAEVLRWVGIVNSYVFPVMNRFMKERLVKQAWGFEADQAFIDSAAEPLALQVRLIDEAVARSGFLVGSTPTIADSFLFPQLLFFAITADAKALLQKAPAAADWLARMRARPSFRRSPMSGTYEAMAKIGAPAAR